jgi:dephospho-CoA kinase
LRRLQESETRNCALIDADVLGQSTFDSRLDAQPSNAERITRADVVVGNNSTLAEMLAQLRGHWERINA